MEEGLWGKKVVRLSLVAAVVNLVILDVSAVLPGSLFSAAGWKALHVASMNTKPIMKREPSYWILP